MIRVLPTMPKFEYSHTCGRCGCHVASWLAMGAGFSPDFMKLCSMCGWAYPRQTARATGRDEGSPAEAEVRQAIKQVRDGGSRAALASRCEEVPRRLPPSREERGDWACMTPACGGPRRESAEKGPVMQSRCGRFQVSTWRPKKTVIARSGLESGRDLAAIRACVQHSRWDWARREWQRQSVWFSAGELRDLMNAIDSLEKGRLEAGWNSPQPFHL